MKSINAKEFDPIVFEPELQGSQFFNCPVEKDLSHFKVSADIIIANRKIPYRYSVTEKVFTLDLFGDK